jgi:hypothetical protein
MDAPGLSDIKIAKGMSKKFSNKLSKNPSGIPELKPGVSGFLMSPNHDMKWNLNKQP